MKIPKVLSVCFVLCCLFVGNVFAVVDVEGCIEIAKEADCQYSKVGDTINYIITIENCGYVELREIYVEDSLLGPLNLECDVLAPHESCTFQVPYDVQAGDPDPLVNEVTVTAEPVFDAESTFNGGVIVEDSASATVELLDPDFTLDVECQTNGGPETILPVNGGYAYFKVLISNTGDIDLDVEVPCLEESIFRLQSGDSVQEIVEVPLEGVGPCGTGGSAELTCCATATIPPDYCDLPNVLERCDTDICETPPCDPTLTVDIKPQSCPNPLAARSKGVLPVAILGTEDFDVMTVDIATITLAGVSPIRSSFKDVATPLDKEDECECHGEGPDGYLDLTLKFDRREIIATLGDLSLLPRRSSIPLTLTCMLMGEEVTLEGTDCIVFLNLRQR